MGLQSQLSDLSSESTVLLVVVLLAKAVRGLRSLLLQAIAFFCPRFHRRRFGYDVEVEVVASGLAGVVLLCEQLNLNRACSYPNRSIDGSGSDCVVCLDPMGDGDHVRKLACGHVFHKDCFDGWLDHLNFDCPLCRAPLVSDERLGCTRRRVARDLLTWSPFQLH